uniref:Uncharacterized protein n=1 Tax=Aegilops tauschii TaxID=37682 RepID=R7W2A7_AEGTA
MALSSLLREPALKSMGNGLGNHGSYHSSSNVNKTPCSSTCLPANRRHASLPPQLLSTPAFGGSVFEPQHRYQALPHSIFMNVVSRRESC